MANNKLVQALRALAEIGEPSIAREIAQKAGLETKEVAALLTNAKGVGFSIKRETRNYLSRRRKEYYLEEWNNDNKRIGI